MGKAGGRMAQMRKPGGQLETVLHTLEDLWHVVEGSLEGAPQGLLPQQR